MVSGGKSYYQLPPRNFIGLCTSVILFHFLIPLLPAQQLQFTTDLYTIEDGLSHNTVLWIEKDAYGFLWINTYNGFNRFDGIHFTNFYRTDHNSMGLIYNSQFKLDSKGDLWNIEPNYRSAKYDYHLDTFHDPLNASHGKEVPFREQDGTLWVYNDTMLFKMEEHGDDSTHVVSEFKLNGIDGEVKKMIEFPKGHLWIHTYSSVYYIKETPDFIDLTKYELEIQNLNKQPEIINWIIPAEDKLWIIADFKLIRAELPLLPDKNNNHLISGEMVVFDRPDIELHADHPIFMVADDGDKNVYFRTYNGIYCFETETKIVEKLYAEDYGTFDWGEGNFQYALKYDPDGILWVGTDKGLLKITLGNKNFHVINQDPLNPEGLNHPKLNSVLVDRNDHLWVGTVGDGLYRGIPDHEGKYKNFEHYLPDHSDPFSLHNTGIRCLFEDSSGDIWLHGDAETQRIKLTEGVPRFLPTPFPKGGSTIEEDLQGNILISGTHSLCWIYNPNTEKAYPLYPDKTITDYSWSHFIMTGDKSYFFKIDKSLYQFHGPIKFSEETGEETGIWTDDLAPFAYPERTTLLLDTSTTAMGKVLATEHDGYKEFWIIQRRDDILHRYQLKDRNFVNGENDLSSRVNMELLKTYSTSNGLSHRQMFEIIEDDSKRIWVTTQYGLTCIDPATEQVYRYYEEDGLPTNKFYWGYHKDRNGIMYLCTTNGLVYFHADSIVSNSPPQVYLTGLSLFNEPVNVGNDSPLDEVIMHTDKISLHHNQNFISFEFAALDFRNPEQVRYLYKMEGLDRDWVDAGKRRIADYSGLRPGNYTFRVIAANSNGIWNREGASVEVLISPPFWYSWWAFFTYGILLLLFLLLIRRFETKRATLKTDLKIERIEKEKSLELDKMKSRFFTNISHEFRTPLTLLLGPIEDSLKTKSTSIETERGVFEMMKRNAIRLQRLINQLLDLSKLETGNERLQVSEGNLSEFIRAIVQSFLSLAESKKITYKVDLPASSQKVYFDSDKLEKILTNLISNAFKFTPENGKIRISLQYLTVSIHEAPYAIEIKVRDSGKGISQDQINKIFDRYFQVNPSETREEEGTGIGLALTKELVDLCKGEIQVESEISRGSVFTVKLPVSKEVFEEDEIVTAILEDLVKTDMDRSEILPGETITDATRNEHHHPNEKVKTGPVILIVEDNADLRSYISGNLGAHYQLLVAENGMAGMNAAIEHIPDLVISDLMMPEMNGMEMCKSLKADERTNHIPIIMLTAKADRDSKLDGLETGADDYIIKPFDAEELRVRVRNLIDQRIKLREKFSRKFFTLSKQNNLIGVDDRFLQKAADIINEHISEDQFTVEMFCSLLGMSNSQINRKLEAITGLTPSLFIRNLRLNHSLVLLEKGYDNVARIALEVGFSDHSYFSKCFRELYGTSPTEYKIRTDTDPAK